MIPEVRKLVLVAGLLCCGALAQSAELLWQIGVFDRSSAEFRPWIDPVSGARLNYADAASDPVFKVGESVPARDWQAYQPGSANGGAGFRPHPFTIQFDLPSAPAGRHRLVIALLAYSARLPMLQAEVNGRVGWFHQSPKLNYEAGDPAVFFLPHYSTSEITIELAPGLLRAGPNRIILTALDDPPERDDTRPAGYPWPGSSGIHYDAILLEPALGSLALPTATVAPAIFYREMEGRLLEQVDVTVTSDAPPSRIVLLLNGAGFTNAPAQDRAFGEWRAGFWVPEFTGPSEARVLVETAGGAREFRQSIQPARKWHLLVVPNVHLDIGYTDFAPKVSEIQSRIIDGALEMIEANPKFRFTPDGFWPVEEFLAGRSDEAKERLRREIMRGKISIPAVHSSIFTGFASLENLIRQLYPSARYMRDKRPIEFALNTDVPNYSWSFASVLAASGLQFFAAASDAYRAPFLLYNRFHEQSPHWWEGPDGGRVVVWYSRHYHQLGSLFGLPYSLASGRDSLPRFLQAYNRPEYKPDSVILYGSQSENADLHPAQARLADDWHRHYAYPRIRYATFEEALNDIFKQAGPGLPVVRGDGGPYWEDGLGANARATALGRANMQRILSAEKASTIARLAKPQNVPDRAALETAWRNVLMLDEHTWHADVSVREPESEQSRRQGELKNSRAEEAARQIDHVLGRGLAALADQVQAPPGTLLIFNPLGWKRGGWVELDLPRGQAIVDLATGQPQPAEILHSGNTLDHVRFWAEGVPSAGYKGYSLRPGAPPSSPQPIAGGVFSNAFYEVRLHPQSGKVLAIIDRASGANLVDEKSPHAFNDYLYVTGADELPNRLVQYSTVSPLPHLQIHSAQSASRLAFIRSTPLGTLARIESSATNTPSVVTEIYLPTRAKRIEIANRISKTYTTRKEAAYFAFPFALEQPRFRWATQNGFVDPTKDLLAGACQEWFLAHAWVEASANRGAGLRVGLIPIDAPLFAVGDIVRGTWPKTFGERPTVIFSYVMNNYTPEGYQAGQGGEHLFRYVLASGAELDPAALHRIGLEAQTPLELNEITRNDKPFLRAEWLPFPEASLLEVDADHLSLVTWKGVDFNWHEDPDPRASILRFVETGGRAGIARLRFPKHRVLSAVQCSAVEESSANALIADGLVQIAVRPHQILTLRVTLEPQN